jgi:hypothetical protein
MTTPRAQPDADRPTYTVTLQAMVSSVPAPVRLRRLLKIAYRALALKCTAVREINDGPAAGPAEQKPH